MTSLDLLLALQKCKLILYARIRECCNAIEGWKRCKEDSQSQETCNIMQPFSPLEVWQDAARLTSFDQLGLFAVVLLKPGLTVASIKNLEQIASGRFFSMPSCLISTRVLKGCHTKVLKNPPEVAQGTRCPHHCQWTHIGMSQHFRERMIP